MYPHLQPQHASSHLMTRCIQQTTDWALQLVFTMHLQRFCCQYIKLDELLQLHQTSLYATKTNILLGKGLHINWAVHNALAYIKDEWQPVHALCQCIADIFVSIHKHTITCPCACNTKPLSMHHFLIMSTHMVRDTLYNIKTFSLHRWTLTQSTLNYDTHCLHKVQLFYISRWPKWLLIFLLQVACLIYCFLSILIQYI